MMDMDVARMLRVRVRNCRSISFVCRRQSMHLLLGDRGFYLRELRRSCGIMILWIALPLA